MSPRTKEQFDKIKETTREKILDAALVVFAHNGFAATSISDIAKAAGISNGLLYHYFSSKEDLFNELIDIAVSYSGAAMMNYRDMKSSAKDRLHYLSEAILDILSRGNKTANYFTLMLQAGLAGNIPAASAEYLKSSTIPFKIMSEIIKEGQREGTFKSGDPMQLAILYWASFQGLCAYKLTMKSFFLAPEPRMLDGVLLKENWESNM